MGRSACGGGDRTLAQLAMAEGNTGGKFFDQVVDGSDPLLLSSR
jgi:hypothetical protein